MSILLRTKIDLGKIAYNRSGRKENAVTIDIELRQRGGEETFTIDPKTKEHIPTGETTPKYMELSICGSVWNRLHTDILCGGQCLDTIAEYRTQLDNKDLFDEVYKLWKGYHLNGMNAGTPEQTALIKVWEERGNKYDYKEACKFLADNGTLTVMFTGKTTAREYKNEPYTYGHEWIVNDLPNEVIETVESIAANNAKF